MGVSEAVITAGILVDAIGALAVVIPDLDEQRRNRLVSVTPMIRRWWKRDRRFPDHNSRGDYPPDVGEALEALAPAIRQSEMDLDPDTFDQIESHRPHGRHHVILYDGDGSKVGDCSIESLNDAVQELIDRKYRFWGFVLLGIGFLIQAVGTLL